VLVEQSNESKQHGQIAVATQEETVVNRKLSLGCSVIEEQLEKNT
jgi:hypothetical protein